MRNTERMDRAHRLVRIPKQNRHSSSNMFDDSNQIMQNRSWDTRVYKFGNSYVFLLTRIKVIVKF